MCPAFPIMTYASDDSLVKPHIIDYILSGTRSNSKVNHIDRVKQLDMTEERRDCEPTSAVFGPYCSASERG